MFSFIERGLYAVLPNAAVFLLVLQKTEKNVTLMQLPDRYSIELESEDLDNFLKIRTLEFVEQLPQDVFDVCKANSI